MSKFINSNFITNNKQYIIYNIVVNRDSQYQNISELKGKELTVYDDLVQELTKDKIDSKIAEKIDKVKISHSDKIEEVMKSVIDDTRKIIAINTGAYAH